MAVGGGSGVDHAIPAALNTALQRTSRPKRWCDSGPRGGVIQTGRGCTHAVLPPRWGAGWGALEMETASRRQSATTGVLTGVGFDWERGNFRRGRSSHMTKWDVHHAGLARYRQGVVGAADGAWCNENFL